MLERLYLLLPYTKITYWPTDFKTESWQNWYFLNRRIFFRRVKDLFKGPKPSKTETKPKQKKAGLSMNIGDKVIAVGMGRKTKELNGGELKRKGDSRLPGFTGLVVDMVVMTVKDIDGDTIYTPFYTFHKDDLHLVDTGRASAPLV
jgi:hypothetical protein